MSKLFFNVFTFFAVIFGLILAFDNVAFAYTYTSAATYTPTSYTSAATYTPTRYTSAATYTPTSYTSAATYTPTSYTSAATYSYSYTSDWLSCGYVGCRSTYVYTPTCTSSCCGSSCYNPPTQHCSNDCSTNGMRQCYGGGYRECNRGSDGCLHWSGVTNCGSGQVCNNGSCLSSCSNECSVSGQRRCSGNGFQQCGNYDSDDCLEWGTVTNCNSDETCNNGSCVNHPTCTNECNLIDQRVCDGNGYKQCGNYDSDSCLEWGAVTNCGASETCNNGSCIFHPTCTNQCVAGEHQCSGSSGRTCGTFGAACTSWGTYQECDSQCFRCGDNRCDCGETQSSCPQDCGYNTPTVDLRSKGSVTCGKEATLTWSSTNADYCTASGSWSGSKGTSGSDSVGDFTGERRFTITCRNSSGSATDSVTLTGSRDNLEVSAGSDKEVYDSNSIRLDGSVDGDYDSLSWSCSGGSLSDNDVEDATWRYSSDYYDHEYDGYGYGYNDKSFTCTLTARNGCGSDSDSMTIRLRRHNEPVYSEAVYYTPTETVPATYIYYPIVKGATTVSTGFDNNWIAGIGLAIAGAAIALFFLVRQFIARKKLTPDTELNRKISLIKKNDLV